MCLCWKPERKKIYLKSSPVRFDSNTITLNFVRIRHSGLKASQWADTEHNIPLCGVTSFLTVEISKIYHALWKPGMQVLRKPEKRIMNFPTAIRMRNQSLDYCCCLWKHLQRLSENSTTDSKSLSNALSTFILQDLLCQIKRSSIISSSEWLKMDSQCCALKKAMGNGWGQEAAVIKTGCVSASVCVLLCICFQFCCSSVFG